MSSLTTPVSDPQFTASTIKMLAAWLAGPEPLLRDAVCEAVDAAVEQWLEDVEEELLNRIAVEVSRRVPQERHRLALQGSSLDDGDAKATPRGSPGTGKRS